MKEIEDGIFGRHVAHIGVVEFQKRGLPHLHLLVTLAPEYKPNSPETIDRIITAEIPDPAEGRQQAVTHQRICDFMLHRKCGEFNPTAPCMVAQRTSFNPAATDEDGFAPNREDQDVAAQQNVQQPPLDLPELEAIEEVESDSDGTIADSDSDATIINSEYEDMEVDQQEEDDDEIRRLLDEDDLNYDFNLEEFVINQVNAFLLLCNRIY